MAADKLAAELAFKANVDAVSRDYICEPHLGVCVGGLYAHGTATKTVICLAAARPDCSSQPLTPCLALFFAEYRTISGVSGPLVVAEGVKVSSAAGWVPRVCVCVPSLSCAGTRACAQSTKHTVHVQAPSMHLNATTARLPAHLPLSCSCTATHARTQRTHANRNPCMQRS